MLEVALGQFPKRFSLLVASGAKECDLREIKEGSLGLEVVEGARLIDNIVQHDGGSASSLQPASGRLVRGTSESSRIRLPMTPMAGWGNGDREGCGLA